MDKFKFNKYWFRTFWLNEVYVICITTSDCRIEEVMIIVNEKTSCGNLFHKEVVPGKNLSDWKILLTHRIRSEKDSYRCKWHVGPNCKGQNWRRRQRNIAHQKHCYGNSDRVARSVWGFYCGEEGVEAWQIIHHLQGNVDAFKFCQDKQIKAMLPQSA